MQENNFEKRVQQQMEELKLRPSDAVWEKIEEEIRKKKKRRVVFFIFLLAGLSLLSYSGYFLFHNSKQNFVEQNSTLTDKKEATENKQTTPAIENEGNEVTKTEKPEQLPLKTEETDEKEKSIDGKQKANSAVIADDGPDNKQTTIKEKLATTAIGDRGLTSERENREENIVSGRRNKNVTKPTGNNDQVVATQDKKNKKNPGLAKEPMPVSERSQPEQTGDSPMENKTGITKPGAEKKPIEDVNVNHVMPTELAVEDKNKVEMVEEEKDTATKESAAVTAKGEIKPAATKKKKIPSINFGLELSYGISSDRDKLSIGGQKSMDMVYNSPQFNSAGPAVSAIYSLPPSSVEDGNAFRAGVIAEMKLSRRSTVSSGLRYAYFSNQIKVGTFKDTAVSFTNRLSQDVNTGAIYRGFQQKKFVNRFHFIQLPLQYELQLNKGNKVPIAWNIGTSLGYLISTNALIYDTMGGGIYYHDEEAFNKFHWNLNTGFLFRLGSKNKIQWSLGPELSLDMSKVMKNEYGQKQYLLYGGITGRIFLVKKK